MNDATKRAIKGCLQVRAIRDTRMGVSDTLQPAGFIGYVLGAAIKEGHYHIFWPDSIIGISKSQIGDHPSADVERTGWRGYHANHT